MAWCAFLDWVSETQGDRMYGHNVGDVLFIETATVYFLGVVAEVGPLHLKLEPGCYEIRHIANLHRFLSKGRFDKADEYTVCRGKKTVPGLAITNAEEWTHAFPKPAHTEAELMGRE